MKRITWKEAYGNRRQEKKLRRFYEQGCGCEYCCPSDRRKEIVDKLHDREMKGLD